MPANPGYQPAETAGKRVRVRFVNGRVAGEGKEGFTGYPAHTVRWDFSDSDWDVAEYEVIH